MNATAHADSPVMDIDLARLAGNWRTVRGRYTGNDLGAVVKCNAYGLGLEPVVNTLSAQGCLQYWALGYDEACRVRALAPAAEVFILNGLRGASARDCHIQRLIPVLNDLDEIAQARRAGALTVAVAVSTVFLTVSVAVSTVFLTVVTFEPIRVGFLVLGSTSKTFEM